MAINFGGGLIRKSVAAAALASMAVFATGAHATTVQLTAYNIADAIGLDLSVDVTTGGGMAMFAFSNNSIGAAADSVIARIYFESGLTNTGLSNGAVVSGSGVSFATSYPGPGNPPAGNAVNWSGNLMAFGSQASVNHNGLGVGDLLTIAFNYTGSTADLVAALTNADGFSRLAVHVLDCQNGNSCAAASSDMVVPVPAALPLLLGALASLGFARRGRRTA